MNGEPDAELLHEKRDSITLKRNAKGEYAWDIKLYFDLANETPNEVGDALQAYDEELRERFL